MIEHNSILKQSSFSLKLDFLKIEFQNRGMDLNSFKTGAFPKLIREMHPILKFNFLKIEFQFKTQFLDNQVITNWKLKKKKMHGTWVPRARVPCNFFFFLKFDHPILNFLQIEFYIETRFWENRVTKRSEERRVGKEC